VSWSLIHRRGNEYVLENTGTAQARNVVVHVKPYGVVDGESYIPLFSPKHRESYLVIGVLGEKYPQMTVTWEPDEGRREKWAWRLHD
jgi:hypothetical protein